MTDITHTHLDAGTFHYIVRGIIRDGEYLLLCKQRNDTYTFLPGGHVEFGESATTALAREVHEELGVHATVGQFVGALENGWDGQFEISLFFEMNDHDLSASSTPQPASDAEAHLEFVWVNRTQLAEANIMPAMLSEWLDHGGWGSTL
ncbi:MAG: NUDIX domain-containing protein [Phycisphaerae bacterium]|nr:NUDIX domain-containing protein [Phycisphaerae bacterium]